MASRPQRSCSRRFVQGAKRCRFEERNRPVVTHLAVFFIFSLLRREIQIFAPRAKRRRIEVCNRPEVFPPGGFFIFSLLRRELQIFAPPASSNQFRSEKPSNVLTRQVFHLHQQNMHRSKYVQSASNIDYDCIKLDVHEQHDQTFKLGTYPIM